MNTNCVGAAEERLIAARAEREAAQIEYDSLTTPGHPPTDARRWGVAKLNAAMRHLRDAEDFWRLLMPAWPTADRIRFIHEQLTADVIDGRTTRPALSEVLGYDATYPVHDPPAVAPDSGAEALNQDG